MTYEALSRCILGVVFIASGANTVTVREVPIGIEGQPPSGVTRGWPKLVIGVGFVAIGIVILLSPDVAW